RSIFAARAPPELSTLSLPDALPISMRGRGLPPHHLLSGSAGCDGDLHHPHRGGPGGSAGAAGERQSARDRQPAQRPAFRGLARRSEEHTSELQSRENLVCRLLLEKK